MSWKKHLQIVQPNRRMRAAIERSNSDSAIGSSSNFTSVLPEVYSGHPQRIDRYSQYDQMDQDSEINFSLDTIADFSTQRDEKDPGKLFKLNFNEDPSDVELKIINDCLKKWCDINEFKKRLWRMFRSTIKYGDQFFIRDPDTYKWMWVDEEQVEKVLVNEEEGKKIEAYIIRDLDINVESLTATQTTQYGSNIMGTGTNTLENNLTPNRFGNVGRNGRFDEGNQNLTAVDAKDVIQLSLSEGLDAGWPFATSILESVYKTYRQKELLEDAILIYRIQRAPERRVFYIDVGDVPVSKAQQQIERFKNEFRQRRLPTRNGEGQNVVDAAYNPMCLDLSTRIPLLDGRTLPLTDLIDEYKSGKENWVYSCNPETGEIVPGNITWAGVTRKDAKVIKITLDNGEEMIVTPDHKIPVQGKGFVEAQYITSEDSLIPFNTRKKSLSKDPNRSYEQVYDISKNKWIYTHRMVGEFFKNIEKHQELTFNLDNYNLPKNVVHHKDFNRYNNDPRNLQWMNDKDHTEYHSYSKKEYWKNISEEESNRIKNKIRNTLKETRKGYSSERIDELSNNRSIGIKKSFSDLKENFPERWKEIRKNVGSSLKKSLMENPLKKKERVKHLKEHQEKPWGNVEFIWSFDMKQRFIEIVKENINSNKEEILEITTNDEKFMNLLRKDNINDGRGINNIDCNKFTSSKLYKFLSTSGYNNWREFKKNIDNFNHRIVSIEVLDYTMDVGTITVDGKERWHSYHTFAIESGIFVKNSMIEDIFMPVTPSGRGSKVDTLPGGQALGQIDDLRYFNNKLIRGLRIPSSYIPTGPDDSQAQVNDGRVGTAYIQEFRFAEYCKRLQRMLAPKFDEEFKFFIREMGFDIESNLFELDFNDPQHFGDFARVERDIAMINTFTPLLDVKFISKRVLLERYLGWSKEEIVRNEIEWREENIDTLKAAIGASQAEQASSSVDQPGLDSVGIRSDDGAGEAMDTDTGGDEMSDQMGDDGGGDSSPVSGDEGSDNGTGAS